MTRRRTVPVVAALSVVLVAAGFVWRDASSEPRAAAVEPTTTTTTAPTTTAVPTTTTPPLDATLTEVATARGALLDVLAELPADVARSAADADLATRRRATFAPLSAERPDAPAIPTLKAQVEGRRRTLAGWQFDNPTPWHNPLVLVVTEHQGQWLRVQIPTRPNGTEGWVRASDVALTTHRFHVSINVGTRMLRAYDGDRQLAETKVVVGKASTPTPTGRFFVTDYEKKARGSAYGPWILPLSAYSQSLDTFAGGVPVIAMHGTNHPELVGSPASNGCIRIPDDVIEQLRTTLPLGTPVDITA